MEKKLYGWVVDGHYYVSRVPPGMRYRPANVYDTMEDAVAGSRGLQIEWEDVVPE